MSAQDKYLCADPDCEMRGMWHMGAHLDASGREYIRATISLPVVPNPVPDAWPGDPFAGIPNARDEDNQPF